MEHLSAINLPILPSSLVLPSRPGRSRRASKERLPRARPRPAAIAAVTRGIPPDPTAPRGQWVDIRQTEARAILTELKVTREAHIKAEAIRAAPDRTDTREIAAVIRAHREPADLQPDRAAGIKAHAVDTRVTPDQADIRAVKVAIRAAAADTRAVPDPVAIRAVRVDTRAARDQAGIKAAKVPADTRAVPGQPAIKAPRVVIRAAIEVILTIPTDRQDPRGLEDTKDPAAIRVPEDTRDQADTRGRGPIRADNQVLSRVQGLPIHHRVRVAILADQGPRALEVPGQGLATPCRADRQAGVETSPADQGRVDTGRGDQPMVLRRWKAAKPRRGNPRQGKRPRSTDAMTNSKRSSSSRKRLKPAPSPFQSPSI